MNSKWNTVNWICIFIPRIDNFMDLHANFQWKYVMKTRFGSRLKAKIDYFIDVITAQQHEWFMKIQAHLFCQMIYAKNGPKVRSWKLFRRMNTQRHNETLSVVSEDEVITWQRNENIYVSRFSEDVFTVNRRHKIIHNLSSEFPLSLETDCIRSITKTILS